mgnify:CR=1 FL=1
MIRSHPFSASRSGVRARIRGPTPTALRKRRTGKGLRKSGCVATLRPLVVPVSARTSGEANSRASVIVRTTAVAVMAAAAGKEFDDFWALWMADSQGLFRDEIKKGQFTL